MKFENVVLDKSTGIKNGDKVFCSNHDGTKSYFGVDYSEPTAEFILIPFTDSTYSTPLSTEGRVNAVPLSEYGFDALEIWED